MSEMENKLRLYESIESLPTWPVSLGTKKVFAATNMVLGSPHVVDLLRGARGWSGLLDMLRPNMAPRT